MWRDALLVGGKDLRIEFGSRVALNQIAPFALSVLVLFGFALGPDPKTLAGAEAGLFWLAVLFSTTLAVQRSFAIEAADDAADGLRLSGLDPAGVFLGKAGAIALQLCLLEVLLSVVAALLFSLPLTSGGVLVVSALAATAGLAALGALYGALSASARVRETLLPLLFLPAAAPVLLGATTAWKHALAHQPGQSLGWIGLVAAFALVYTALGVVVFGPMLEDR
ncbi:MAG TPA: heme exporter protein CcmB [Acidimicrobiales bacterium]|nr:heme exporter protein CcmB [Acidimicrobiales bacterium]